MSKILLGDDGEIYPQIDCSKGSKKSVESSNVSGLPLSAPIDHETELLLALPQLFLLDADNAAFIAGKKMKKQRQRKVSIPFEKWDGRDGKAFWLSLFVFLCWIILGVIEADRLHNGLIFEDFLLLLAVNLAVIWGYSIFLVG